MPQWEQSTAEEQGGHVHLWSLQQNLKADQWVVDSAKDRLKLLIFYILIPA